MIALFLLVFAVGISIPEPDLSKYSKECIEKAYAAEARAGGAVGDRNYAFLTTLENCK